MAYIARTTATGELWVQSLDGKTQAHAGGLPYVRSPTWSPVRQDAGRARRPGPARFQVYAMTVKPTVDWFEIGEPRQITRDGSIDASSGLTWAE